jgi:hypothetical protein
VTNKQPEIGSALLALPKRLQNDTGTVVAGGGESHLVQVFDLTEVDSWRAVGAFTAVRFDDTRRDAEIPSSQAEELPELLDFSIDLEGILAEADALKPPRAPGKVLKFERPAHMKAAPRADLSNATSTTGLTARVLEFPRPEDRNPIPR